MINLFFWLKNKCLDIVKLAWCVLRKRSERSISIGLKRLKALVR